MRSDTGNGVIEVSAENQGSVERIPGVLDLLRCQGEELFRREYSDSRATLEEGARRAVMIRSHDDWRTDVAGVS